MQTFENKELGVALDITESGHCLRSTITRRESMMGDDRVFEWQEKILNTIYQETTENLTNEEIGLAKKLLIGLNL